MVLSYFAHLLPVSVVAVLLFCTVTYFCTGLFPGADRFWIYTATCYSAYLFGETVGVSFVCVRACALQWYMRPPGECNRLTDHGIAPAGVGRDQLCFLSNNVANSASALFLTISTLMASGFFRSYNRMPQFVFYLSYVSIYKYQTEVGTRASRAPFFSPAPPPAN